MSSNSVASDEACVCAPAWLAQQRTPQAQNATASLRIGQSFQKYGWLPGLYETDALDHPRISRTTEVHRGVRLRVQRLSLDGDDVVPPDEGDRRRVARYRDARIDDLHADSRRM